MQGSDRKKTRIPQSYWSSDVSFTPDLWEYLEAAGATPLDSVVRAKLEHLAGVYRDRTAMLLAGEPVLNVKKKLHAVEQAATQLTQALQNLNEKNKRSAWNRFRTALAITRQKPVDFLTELKSIAVIIEAAQSAIGQLPEGKNEPNDPNLEALIFCTIGIFRDDAKGGGPYSLNCQKFIHTFCSFIGVSSEHLPEVETAHQSKQDRAFYKMITRAIDRFSEPNKPPALDWTDRP